MTAPSSQKTISIPVEDSQVEGILTIPDKAKGLVLFAHGSGSGRHSPRNQFVAQFLNRGHLATLLMDLLTSEEEEIDLRTRHLRFDIPLLAQRLILATDYVKKEVPQLGIGYFGSSTGAAAALIAAAEKGQEIKAVVSRGGRPDLAGSALRAVQAPTLLIVGGNDFGVIELNQEALTHLPVTKKIEIVPHATHLFEEPGALEKVAQLAKNWFIQYL